MIFDYLLIYIIACSLIYAYLGSFERHKNVYLLLVFIPLTILLGLRSLEVGVDTESYYNLFEFAKSEGWSYLLSKNQHYGSETGYLCLNKLFSYISTDYKDFQLVEAVLFCTGWAFIIKRDLKHPVLGVALFLGSGMYLYAFNISRQLLVIMLSVLCYPIICNKRIYAAIIIFLLAQIHTTAYLLFLVLLIYSLPKSYKELPFALLLFVFFFSEIMLYSSEFFTKYESFYENSSQHHSFTIGYSAIMYILIILVSIKFYYRTDVSDIEKKNAFLSAFSVLCTFLGLQMNYMERVGIAFTPFTFLTLIAIRDRMTDKTSKNVYSFGMIFFMFFYFYLRSPKDYTFIM